MNQSNYKIEIINDFTVECLGEVDDYVYDIEVAETHNFFANNILVHNSNYLDVTDLVYHPKLKWNELDDQKIVDKIDQFCTKKIDVVLEKAFDKLAGELNSYKQTISMKREAIGKGVFVAPKNYTLLVYDNEGQRYLEPELKVTGLEAVRSDTPKIFREQLKKMYKMMYYNSNADIQAMIKEFHDSYIKMPLIDIGEPSGVNLEKYSNTNQLGVFESGCPYHVKAAFTYNTLIKNMGLESKYPLVRQGDKIKLYRLKKENPFKNDRIAIVDKVPVELELELYVDREEMFETTFIKACDRVLKVRGWSAHKKIDLSAIFDW